MVDGSTGAARPSWAPATVPAPGDVTPMATAGAGPEPPGGGVEATGVEAGGGAAEVGGGAAEVGAADARACDAAGVGPHPADKTTVPARINEQTIRAIAWRRPNSLDR
jgi:hypothetical protein